MNKISPYWLILALVIGIVAAYIYFEFIRVPDKIFSVRSHRNRDVITLSLPNSVDPAVFGPKYWEAYHKLTEMLPCSSCRGKAVPFMRFFHDVVNKSLGKELFDKENYTNWINEFKKQ